MQFSKCNENQPHTLKYIKRVTLFRDTDGSKTAKNTTAVRVTKEAATTTTYSRQKCILSFKGNLPNYNKIKKLHLHNMSTLSKCLQKHREHLMQQFLSTKILNKHEQKKNP